MCNTRIDIFVFRILLTELCLQGVEEEEAGEGVLADHERLLGLKQMNRDKLEKQGN